MSLARSIPWYEIDLGSGFAGGSLRTRSPLSGICIPAK